MKKLLTLLLTALAVSSNAQAEDVTVKTGTFGNDWESLSAWERPLQRLEGRPVELGERRSEERPREGLELINDYDPDMIYFDDTAMPFYGCDDQIGKNILQHDYNHSAAGHDGKQQVVVTGKQLTAQQKGYMM